MGRTPRRAGTEAGGIGGGWRLFLFDENVTSIGRALAHVYDQVVLLEDIEKLGRRAEANGGPTFSVDILKQSIASAQEALPGATLNLSIARHCNQEIRIECKRWHR